MDRLDSFLNNAPRVDGAWPKKWGLCAEGAAARLTTMHADFDGQDDRLVQVHIHRTARCVPKSGRSAAAARTRDRGKTPAHLADGAGLRTDSD
jgi:hypothetical protein